jgi:hypothetical protein
LKELINFSTHPGDLQRFNNDWQEVERFVRNHECDGLELLIGYDELPEISENLVQAVHLPFLISWLDIWRDDPDAFARYYPGLKLEHAHIYCGGRNSSELIKSQRLLWEKASSLNANYAVFHVCHIEMPHTYTRKYTYTDNEVVDAAADFLNSVAGTFENGEPPIRLFLENLWWPGLNFTSGEVTERLTEKINFNNWAFVLDTSHLINTNWELETEEQAIDFLLYIIEGLPIQTKERIEGLHLNLSISSAYQKRDREIPEEYYQDSFYGKYSIVREHVRHIDQHNPFTSPRCREIAEALKPDYVVHELLGASLEELSAKIKTQRAAFHKEALI